MESSLKLLQNVRVLAFTQFLLGPATAQYLADMGAEVIKIEPPGSGSYERRWSGGESFPGGVSAFFLLAHRNVRSMTLDLRREEGPQIIRRLVRETDVVLENFRPGVMERFGLGYEALKEERPDLIYATGSGFGADSPYRHLPGQDLLLQARTGLATVTGRADQGPVAAGAAVVDQHAASLLAMGVLGALFHRGRTGEGQRLEVNMVQAAFDLQLEPLVYHLNGGTVQRPREALGSAFHEAPYGFYETADGHIALSLSPVALISEALGRPAELRALAGTEIAFSRREEIHRSLGPLLHQRTTSELVELFTAHGIWCAPVNNYETALTDPVIEHVDPLLELDHPEAGKVRTPKHPVRYSSGEAAVRNPPRCGEHSDEILEGLGYDSADVASLRAHAVV